MCVCVFSVCVLSVCVCVCVCVCVSLRYANRTNTIHANTICVSHASRKNHTSQLNLHPTQFPYPTALLRCSALPTRARQKLLSTFHFKILNSIFFFLLPPWVSIFCLPADEATAKSVKNNSPKDSEKQTAVASKDNGIFFLTKPLLCQLLTTLVKTPPASASLTSLAMVCV